MIQPGRLDGDLLITCPVGQRDGPIEGGAGIEHELIAGLSTVDGRLQVVPRVDIDHARDQTGFHLLDARAEERFAHGRIVSFDGFSKLTLEIGQTRKRLDKKIRNLRKLG